MILKNNKNQGIFNFYCNLKNPFGFVESSYTQILFLDQKPQYVL